MVQMVLAIRLARGRQVTWNSTFESILEDTKDSQFGNIALRLLVRLVAGWATYAASSLYVWRLFTRSLRDALASTKRKHPTSSRGHNMVVCVLERRPRNLLIGSSVKAQASLCFASLCPSGVVSVGDWVHITTQSRETKSSDVAHTDPSSVVVDCGICHAHFSE